MSKCEILLEFHNQEKIQDQQKTVITVYDNWFYYFIKNRSLSHRIQIVTNLTVKHKALSQVVRHSVCRRKWVHILWPKISLDFVFFAPLPRCRTLYVTYDTRCARALSLVWLKTVWNAFRRCTSPETIVQHDSAHMEVSYVHFHKRLNGWEQFSIWCSATVCSRAHLVSQMCEWTSTATKDKQQCEKTETGEEDESKMLKQATPAFELYIMKEHYSMNYDKPMQ